MEGSHFFYSGRFRQRLVTIWANFKLQEKIWIFYDFNENILIFSLRENFSVCPCRRLKMSHFLEVCAFDNKHSLLESTLNRSKKSGLYATLIEMSLLSHSIVAYFWANFAVCACPRLKMAILFWKSALFRTYNFQSYT